MAENGLIPICELMGQNFPIPHYQRGYRWENQEVTELLDDLWAFENDAEPGDFYCLQPIVLQKNDEGNFDVLDGQQRLTTLYLILVYLENVNTVRVRIKKSRYSLCVPGLAQACLPNSQNQKRCNFQKSLCIIYPCVGQLRLLSGSRTENIDIMRITRCCCTEGLDGKCRLFVLSA